MSTSSKMFVSLDSVATSSINLLPPSSTHLRSSTDSVFSILNKTITTSGKSTLQDWVRKPLYDIQAINDRHNVVDYFTNDQDLLSEVSIILYVYIIYNILKT